MELFIDIVMKRIYLFNTVAWNYRKKIKIKKIKFRRPSSSPEARKERSCQSYSASHIRWKAERSFHRPTFIRPEWEPWQGVSAGYFSRWLELNFVVVRGEKKGQVSSEMTETPAPVSNSIRREVPFSSTGISIPCWPELRLHSERGKGSTELSGGLVWGGSDPCSWCTFLLELGVQ